MYDVVMKNKFLIQVLSILVIVNTASAQSYKRQVGKISYEIKDHLGDVSVVISDVKEYDVVTGKSTAQVLSAINYYTFGMEMPGRMYSSAAYRYGYNGKEKDNELKGNGNSLDYDARIYDPRIGKWLSNDPLQQKYPGLSPYNYVANNPVSFIDPDGKEIVDAQKRRMVYLDSKGDVQYTKYATMDAKTLVNEMGSTKIGNEVLRDMITANYPITMKIDKDTRPTYRSSSGLFKHTKEEGSYLVGGVTQPGITKDGKAWAKADITIFEGTIDFLMKNPKSVTGVVKEKVDWMIKSKDFLMGGVMVHEGTHSVDPDVLLPSGTKNLEEKPEKNRHEHYKELEKKEESNYLNNPMLAPLPEEIK